MKTTSVLFSKRGDSECNCELWESRIIEELMVRAMICIDGRLQSMLSKGLRK